MRFARRTVTLVAGLSLGAALVATPAWAEQGLDLVTSVLPGQDVLRDRDGKLVVHVAGADPKALDNAVRAAGGRVTDTGDGKVKAVLPPDTVDDVSRASGVQEVRLPERAVPMAVTSEGVAQAKADLWIREGKKGAGVKVGVIDVGFGGLDAARQKGELPAVITNTTHCADPNAQSHGTSVAEIVHDMAPEAQLLLACADETMGFARAETWLRAQGAKIVVAAIGFPATTGRGDGTGADTDSPAEVVKRSRRDGGILWSVAAGNQAQQHFSGPAVDNTRDEWVEFRGTTQNNGFPAPAGAPTTVSLRWDAWPKTTEDLDLYLMSTPTKPNLQPGQTDPNILARSTNPQRDTPGGRAPVESVTFTGTGRTVWIWIRNVSAKPTTKLDLFVNAPSGELQIPVPSGSIVEPATSPYVVAVGATQPGSGVIAPYSSQGPTVDGRTKPDITGYDHVTTSTSGDTPFSGTSAAAAHVAGAAAILTSAHPELETGELEAELKRRADADDVNNVWGHGKLSLGVPGTLPVTESAGYRTLSDPRRISDVRMGPGQVVHLDVPGIPTDATAVALNVTARSDAETRVDVFPADPNQLGTKTSTLEVRPGGGFTAVMTISTLGKDRALKVRNHTGTSFVVVDLLGYFAKSSQENYSAKPSAQRISETRLGAGEVQEVHVRGSAGMPDNATAVLVNLTASESTDETWLSAYSQNHGLPSTLNLRRGDRRSNLAVVAVAPDGKIRVRNERGAVVVTTDVVGWFGPGQGARYVALTEPVRIVDTANGTGVPARALPAGGSADFQVSGVAGVTSSATAAVLNVTGVENRVGTELSVAAVEQGRTSVPSVHAGQGQNVAGAVLAPLGASGRLGLRNERGTAQAAVDLHGYFTGGTKAGPSGCALPNDPGFRSVFDGRNGTSLESWQTAGQHSSTVDGCALVTAPGGGVTWYSGESVRNDYTLKLDWRATSAQADSGVFIGFDHPVGGPDMPAAQGLEIQIAPPDATGEVATGAIVGKRRPDILNAAKPVGEWNTYEITVSWNRITVRLNEQQVNEYTHTEEHRLRPESFIGVQHHGAGSAVQFRDIRLRDNAVTGVGTLQGFNNKCLDVAGAKPADNKVIAYTCAPGYHRAQSWTLPGDGSIRAYNKCLDVVNGERRPGSPVQLFDCIPWGAQNWQVRPDGSVVNPRSGLCLASSSGDDGATLSIEVCGGQRQTWRPKLTEATTGALTLAGTNCLDVETGSPDSGTVIVWTCSGKPQQAWSTVADGTVRAYGKCLDVEGDVTAAGTPVILWECNGKGAQKWEHRPDGALVNPPSQRCLTAASPAEGAKLTIEDCRDEPTQRWRSSAQFLSTGQLTGVVFQETRPKCLDVADGKPEQGKVMMYQCTGGEPQVWSTPGDGTIRAYNRCLDVTDAATEPGTGVTLYECNGTQAQQWVRRITGQLVNPKSGHCLDAGPNGMQIWNCHLGANQRWSLAGRTR